MKKNILMTAILVAAAFGCSSPQQTREYTGYVDTRIGTGGHGHVVAAVPGEAVYSTNWGCNVPMVMDTGEDKRYSSISVKYCFGKDKIPNVHFYLYDPQYMIPNK